MLARLLQAMLWAFSGGAALLYLVLAGRRIGHPLAFDPVEGLVLDHALRFLDGRVLYPAPSAEFVAPAIPPGFPWLVSGLAAVFGPSLWEARLLSVVATLAIAWLIARLVRDETQSWTLGAAGAGLWFAGYGLAGGTTDLGRPQVVMLALALAGFVLLRATRKWRGEVGAALALAAALFVHTQAVFFIVGAIGAMAFFSPRRLIGLCATLALAVGGGVWLANQSLGPGFADAVLAPLGWARADGVLALAYVRDVLAGTLGITFAAILLAFAMPKRPWTGPDGQWTWFGFAALGAAFAAALDPLAGPGARLPVALALGVLAPVAILHVAHHLSAWPGSTRMRGHTVAAAAIVLQFLPLLYDPRDFVPDAAAATERTRFVTWLREQPGDVLLPEHGYLAPLAGRPGGFQLAAARDLVRSGRVPSASADALLGSAGTPARPPALLIGTPLERLPELAPVAAQYREARGPRVATLDDHYPGLPRRFYVREDAMLAEPVGPDSLAAAVADSALAITPGS